MFILFSDSMVFDLSNTPSEQPLFPFLGQQHRAGQYGQKYNITISFNKIYLHRYCDTPPCDATRAGKRTDLGSFGFKRFRLCSDTLLTNLIPYQFLQGLPDISGHSKRVMEAQVS